MLTTIYDNASDACLATGKFFDGTSGKRLHMLPYNRFAAADESGLWWLSPRPANPSFRYGKFIFSMDDSTSQLFVGLHVEKGLHPPERRKQYLMDTDWLWHDFVRALTAGQLGDTRSSIARKCHCNPTMVLGGSYEVSKYTCFQYEWASDGLRYLSGDSRVGGLELTGFAGDMELAEFSGKLASFTEDPWAWVDVMIGLRFNVDMEAPDSWGASEFVAHLLEPLESWTR